MMYLGAGRWFWRAQDKGHTYAYMHVYSLIWASIVLITLTGTVFACFARQTSTSRTNFTKSRWLWWTWQVLKKWMLWSVSWVVSWRLQNSSTSALQLRCYDHESCTWRGMEWFCGQNAHLLVAYICSCFREGQELWLCCSWFARSRELQPRYFQAVHRLCLRRVWATTLNHKTYRRTALPEIQSFAAFLYPCMSGQTWRPTYVSAVVAWLIELLPDLCAVFSWYAISLGLTICSSSVAGGDGASSSVLQFW